MEDEREWASPGSLEGLLQRGRGEGHLRALQEPDEAGEVVIRCVIEDPRWDHQVETRSLYYARLIRELGLRLDPLGAHLFDASDHEVTNEYRSGLTLQTLGDLARYGDSEALELLRRYVARGWSCNWALQEIEALDDPSALDGLGAAMVDRFGDADTLIQEVGAYDLMRGVSWKRWAETQPTIRQAQKQSASQVDEERPVRIWEKSETSAADLLDAVARDARITYPVERRLRDHGTAEDLNLMLAAVREGTEGSKSASLRALGAHRDDRLLEFADEALSDEQPHRVQNSARLGVVRLGTPASVAWARERAALTNRRGETAIEVLAEHGDKSDVPALLNAFERARANKDIYLLCDLADGFGRLQDERGVPLLEATFRDAVYSYLRKRCAIALSATAPAFPGGLAVESLWDCEPETRLTGAKVVSLDRSGVIERLRALSVDEVDDDDVREAAKQRIGDGHGR